MSDPLFQPITLGDLHLPNRIIMSPMTRTRAGAGDVPTDLMALYYRQRASAGLIVTEGTQIEPRGQGYAWTPGIYSAGQIDGWRKEKVDGMRIDMIWSNRPGRTLYSRVIFNGDNYPVVSDHFGVIAAEEASP